jgi:pimeloyl-ACP methyl ester carboxylesterase
LLATGRRLDVLSVRRLLNDAIRLSFPIVVLCTTSLLAAPQDRFFDSAGMQIHYLEEGAGEPVILLHGFTSSAESWLRNGVFPELAKRYHVIALDCRGHGQSGKPHNPDQYGREMGRDVIRLLDARGIKRAHIVGYSLGAQIVAQLVVSSPERFRTATLGGASGRWAWTADDEQLANLEATEMEQRMLRSQLLRVGSPNGPPLTEEQIRAESARRLAGLDTTALAALRRSMRETVVSREQVGAIKIPTLGIVGSDDPALKDFLNLQKLLPTLKLVIVDGASHVATPTRPEFMRSVLQFLMANEAV